MHLYADHNADAPVHPAALTAYHEVAKQAGAAKAALPKLWQRAQEQIAAALGARSEEVIFTSGGTEANAIALLGALDGFLKAEGPLPHVVSSSIEHASVRNTLHQLAKTQRIRLTEVAPTRCGQIDGQQFVAALTAETVLASCVGASNETGVLQPILDIAAACRERQILCHTDAVQMLGRVPLHFASLGVDLLTVSGHKMGAVPGVGALLVHPLVSLNRQLGSTLGYGAQNTPGICSMAAAVAALPGQQAWQEVAELRDYFECALLRLGHVEVLGGTVSRLPNTSCLRFSGCEGDGIMMALDLEGVFVSTGSACSSGSIEPSPILMGMGLSSREAKEAVRFSFGADWCAESMQHLVRLTTAVVQRMRG